MKLEEWRGNPSAQKKTWIALGIVAAMLAFLWMPSPNDIKRHLSATPTGSARDVAAVTSNGISVRDAKPMMPQDRVPASARVAAPASAFVGRWAGQAVLPPEHGLCRITLEVGSNADGTSSGYSTSVCQPPASDYMSGGVNPSKYFSSLTRLQTSNNPTAAILIGTTDASGVLHFKVTKNIGVAQANHGCNMTSADMTPFGVGRMAFEWREENCLGGQIVMTLTK